MLTFSSFFFLFLVSSCEVTAKFSTAESKDQSGLEDGFLLLAQFKISWGLQWLHVDKRLRCISSPLRVSVTRLKSKSVYLLQMLMALRHLPLILSKSVPRYKQLLDKHVQIFFSYHLNSTHIFIPKWIKSHPVN